MTEYNAYPDEQEAEQPWWEAREQALAIIAGVADGDKKAAAEFYGPVTVEEIGWYAHAAHQGGLSSEGLWIDEIIRVADSYPRDIDQQSCESIVGHYQHGWCDVNGHGTPPGRW